MSDATESKPVVGQLLDGRYEIVREIATGGMSVVYEAKHVRIGRRVAIKVLHREMAGDAEVVARFLNEARAVGTFGHPNIVASTDFGELQGHVPYLVLEYLEGQTLQQEIADEGPLPFRRLARIAVQIASALEAAHARNVVHRDLTSSNIFLLKRPNDPDHIKVLDFGISKFLEASDATPKTRRGLTMGTPEFMAPEQICDPDAVDSRVDIYALGVILYHMLEGRYPFTRTPLQALLTQIVVEPPPPLQRQGVPPELQVILAKALAKNPLDRFPSMREMGLELDQVARRITSKPFDVAEDRPRVAPAPALVSAGTPRSVAGQAASMSAEMARAVPPARPGTPAAALAETSTARISVARAKVFDVPAAGQAVAGSSFAAGGHRKLALAALVVALGAVGGVAVLLLRQPVAAPPAQSAAPAITAAPAPAPPAPVPAPVQVNVTSPTADARLTLRGRTYRLPFNEELSAGSQPEIFEVTAPGREGRRFWITLDRPIDLAAALPVGKGATEASAEETVIALGGKAIAEATGPDRSPASSSPGERGRPHRASSAQPRAPAEHGASLVLAKMTGHAETRRAPSEAPQEPHPAPPPKTAVEPAPKTAAATTAPDANATAPVPSPALSPVAAGTSASQPQKARAPALAARPPVAATPTPASRGLDPARTQAMVRARLPEVQRCYERGKMDDPDLRGRVTIRISVSPIGAVTSAAVESSSLRSSSVESCIVATVQTWQFPAPVGGPAVISYPFNFH